MPGIRSEAGQGESIESEVTQLSPPQETHGAARYALSQAKERIVLL